MKKDTTNSLTDQDDPGGYRRETFKMNLKIRLEKIERMESDKIPLFSKMLYQLDESSLTALECEGADFDDAMENKDPLSLW